MLTKVTAPSTEIRAEDISARLERLPISWQLIWTRIIVGAATFFDGYTVLAIAFATPLLVREWSLEPYQVGLILSSGFFGQIVGALYFGWLAERVGRVRVLLITILLFTLMDIACLFAWNAWSMIAFRFLQGIGTGGEVPVASAYINEFIGAKRRGRFFLLYEVIFPVGTTCAGIAGYFLVPLYGWRVMFIVGLAAAIFIIPLRWLVEESPRWLASKGRLNEAEEIVSKMENRLLARGWKLPPPVTIQSLQIERHTSSWREIFTGVYLKRTMTIWPLWFCVYVVNNGLIVWLPTLYREWFKLQLQTSLGFGFITSACGVVASATCALLIDRVGRKRWYMIALLAGAAPHAALSLSKANSPTEILVGASIAYAIVQTIAFSLYLYSAELYPTRLRAIATGLGSAWLRIGSSTGPLIVAWVVSESGIQHVFIVFSGILLVSAVITAAFATETKGRILEELSP
jgi:MFS transporter, putative metabolite:H+ symporter